MIGPRVVGVDLSLTSTGLADNEGRVDRVRTAALDKSLPMALRRQDHIRDAVTHFARLHPRDADLIVIEGPSFASTGGQAHDRAGLWWRCAEAANGIAPVLVVPPTVRAMYATGRGNAGKDEVLAAVIRRYPTWDVSGNDVADAVTLAALGARMLGHPVDGDLPKTHLRALDKLVLP